MNILQLLALDILATRANYKGKLSMPIYLGLIFLSQKTSIVKKQTAYNIQKKTSLNNFQNCMILWLEAVALILH